MALSFVSFWFAMIASNPNGINGQDICIWGRHNRLWPGPNQYLHINGLYRRMNNMENGRYYYRLDNTGMGCDSDTYYIYWYNATNYPGAYEWLFGWNIGRSTDDFGRPGISLFFPSKQLDNHDTMTIQV